MPVSGSVLQSASGSASGKEGQSAHRFGRGLYVRLISFASKAGRLTHKYRGTLLMQLQEVNTTVGQASRLTKCTSKPACECRAMPDLQIGHGVASYDVSPLTDI